MNMVVLKKSRKKQKSGDVFVLQMKGDDKYYFGRIVSLKAKIGGFDNVILIYIYNAFSKSKDEMPRMDKDNLLVPPIGTNRLPWTRGYFETIRSAPIEDNDVLDTHCFFDYLTKKYYNDQGKQLPRRIELCGEYGLHSFRTIDDAVSEVLGIPLSEEEYKRYTNDTNLLI